MIMEVVVETMVVVGSKILVAETTAIIITTAAIAAVVAGAITDQAEADKVTDKVVVITAVVAGLRSATNFISSYK
jgi:hypothetical protein